MLESKENRCLFAESERHRRPMATWAAGSRAVENAVAGPHAAFPANRGFELAISDAGPAYRAADEKSALALAFGPTGHGLSGLISHILKLNNRCEKLVKSGENQPNFAELARFFRSGQNSSGLAPFVARAGIFVCCGHAKKKPRKSGVSRGLIGTGPAGRFRREGVDWSSSANRLNHGRYLCLPSCFN